MLETLRRCPRATTLVTSRLCQWVYENKDTHSIPAGAMLIVFTNDYLGQVVVPLLTFPETSIATEARVSA